MIEDKTDASQKIADAKEQKQASTGGKPTMRVKIYSPFKTFYDEDSLSVSAVNATGPFDILPHHHNFMTLLEPGIVAIRPANQTPPEQKIRISGGLMHVKADKITIFLDI